MTANICGSFTPGLAVLLGMALLLAPASIAQEAAESQEPGAGQTAEEPEAEAADGEPDHTFIEEIVVTAQKREETLLEVPLSHLRDPANLNHEPAPWRDHMAPPPSYSYGKHLIWGATARMLGQFLEVTRPD